MTSEQKIKAGLTLWLKEFCGVEDATDVTLHESEVERGWDTGCDTCGYGADEDKITTTITYRSKGQWGSETVEGTSINFLPVLLEYIDRATSDLG